MSKVIYFNNAATTWPKPEIVYETVDDSFRTLTSPERTAGDEGRRSAAIMETCRREVADFLGIANPQRLIFTPSCTYALNLALLCQAWQSGDQILVSGLEHNAVSRPIRKLVREKGIEFLVAPYRPDNPIDLDFCQAEFRKGKTRLVACTFASNVTGDIFPIAELGKLCRQYDVRLLVDAAQAAGAIPIDLSKLAVDFLAFAGHKAVLGPPGIGGLFVREGIDLNTLAEGGTGRDTSEHEICAEYPSKFEVGTHNLLGIAGLTAGVRFLCQAGMNEVRSHMIKLTEHFLQGVRQLPGITVFGNPDPLCKTATVSLAFERNTPRTVACWLCNEHNVITRSGFHCAPLAHDTLGTSKRNGTIRFSFGFSNQPDEIDSVLGLLAEIPAMRV